MSKPYEIQAITNEYAAGYQARKRGDALRKDASWHWQRGWQQAVRDFGELKKKRKERV
jgi:hypothetical protein